MTYTVIYYIYYTYITEFEFILFQNRLNEEHIWFEKNN